MPLTQLKQKLDVNISFLKMTFLFVFNNPSFPFLPKQLLVSDHLNPKEQE